MPVSLPCSQNMKREHYVTTTGFLDHVREELDKKVRTY